MSGTASGMVENDVLGGNGSEATASFADLVPPPANELLAQKLSRQWSDLIGKDPEKALAKVATHLNGEKEKLEIPGNLSSVMVTVEEFIRNIRRLEKFVRTPIGDYSDAFINGGFDAAKALRAGFAPDPENTQDSRGARAEIDAAIRTCKSLTGKFANSTDFSEIRGLGEVTSKFFEDVIGVAKLMEEYLEQAKKIMQEANDQHKENERKRANGLRATSAQWHAIVYKPSEAVCALGAAAARKFGLNLPGAEISLS